MRLPIQYALTYPERVPNPELPKLDWKKIKELTFEPPDLKKFPCLELAIKAAKAGGTSPAVLCAADEIAVALFLKESIKFTDIARLVDRVLQEHQVVSNPTLDQTLAADNWAKEKATEISKKAKTW